MKVYNEVTINMNSGEVIGEDSFEYSGDVALCKGGGGGGSGAVDYPDYMEEVHEDWLRGAVPSTLTTENITAIMASAIGASPFSGETAYDPDTELDKVDTALSGFNTVIDALSHNTDWATTIAAVIAAIDASVITTTYINDDVNEYAEVLDDQIESQTLPRFEAGMSDINAVISSSFPIGRSNIEGHRNRDVAKHASNLRLQLSTQRNEMTVNSTSAALDMLMKRVQFEGMYAQLIADAKRIRVVASKEQVDQDLVIAESDARWDLEVFQYGANVLAAIGGGTVTAPPSGMSKGASALSGAMAGASIGATPGLAAATGGWSIGIGAAAGLLGGLL